MRIFLGILIFIAIIVGIALLELLSQISRYQAYWNHQNSQKPAKNAIVYVAFGDSTAQGIGASKPENGYVGVLSRELSKAKGRPVHIINLSKSGARIRDVITTQLPSYENLKLQVDITTIEIGANDIIGFDAARFEKDMDELMGKLPKSTIISDIPPFSGSRMFWLEPKVEQANRIMQKLARKHGFELARLHEKLSRNGGLKTYAADLFHPNDYAYRENWAPAFKEQIN